MFDERMGRLESAAATGVAPRVVKLASFTDFAEFEAGPGRPA